MVDALATGQLHVRLVALDVGVIGDNQSAGITVADASALDARGRAQPCRPNFSPMRHATGCESAVLPARGEASDAGELPCSRSAQNYYRELNKPAAVGDIGD